MRLAPLDHPMPLPYAGGVPVSFARRSRHELVDAARAAGPDAPTLCGEWTVRDLLCHVVLRERRPWAAPGMFVPALAPLTDRSMAALARKPFPELLSLAGTPAPQFAVDALERQVNTLEFFVHTEDVRRAQPTWSARSLAPADEAELWRALRMMGRVLVRQAGVPVTVTDGSRSAVLRQGEAGVVVRGPVSELALFCFGRRQVEPLEFDGPAEAVARLQSAALGL